MKKTLYFAVFLMVTSGLVTLVAFVGYNWTEPIIAENRAAKVAANIAILFDPEEGYKQNPDQPDNAYGELNRKYTDNSSGNISGVYEVLDENDDLFAIIYNVNGQGRNGTVYALVAVDPYVDEILSVSYYDHTETPDRGERYMRENRIELIVGQPVLDVQVDAIAGATTTWTALNKMYEIIALHYIDEEVHIDG